MMRLATSFSSLHRVIERKQKRERQLSFPNEFYISFSTGENLR